MSLLFYFILFYFILFYFYFWCACVVGCDSSLGFWLLWLVVVVKVLYEFDLLGLYGNDFFVLSSCAALFSISLSLIVFYIEDNVRFRCGEDNGNLNFTIFG